MSIEHDVTYKFAYGSSTLGPVTRKIIGANATTPDLQIPAGSRNYPISESILLSKVLSLFLVCDQAVTLKAGGVNAVQQVAITGGPTGGTFTLTLGGQTTAAIPYNATAAQVQTALVALSTISAGGVVCAGGPLPGTPVSVAFAALNAIQPVATMTHADSLTGGTSPAVAVTSTTTGVGPDTTISINANVPYVWDAQAYSPILFLADVVTLYITNTSGVGANFSLRTLSSP